MTEVFAADWQYEAICPVCKKKVQVIVHEDGSFLVNHE